MIKKIVLTVIVASFCWTAHAQSKDEVAMDVLVASYTYIEAPATSEAGTP